MSEEIINKVANSGLRTINLEDYFQKGERCFFDMKNYLFEELDVAYYDYLDYMQFDIFYFEQYYHQL